LGIRGLDQSLLSIKNKPVTKDHKKPQIWTDSLDKRLYGCETWSLTLREEHKLRVFENRVLRRIFGPKRDEVTRGWRKLHNEGLHNFYSSPSMVRMIKSRRM
jgi:hypothetical protein